MSIKEFDAVDGILWSRKRERDLKEVEESIRY